MRTVDHFFVDSVSETLYHYTGIDSLLGIASTRTLWASHISYLNDSKELIQACDLLQDAIKPRLVFDHALTPQEKDFAEQFQEWVKDFYRAHFCLFVFSLSRHASLLSQWRSYTPHGKGISIGIGAETLNKIAKSNNLKIARCVYDTNVHRELLANLFEKLLVTFRQEAPRLNLNGRPPGQEYHGFLERFRGDVLQVLAVMKHPAFEEEQEWRLISPYYPSYVTSNIKFREGASLLVPYTEFRLDEDELNFESVTLGPTPHEALSMSALSMFLSNQRLSNQAINSRIPYRQWTV